MKTIKYLLMIFCMLNVLHSKAQNQTKYEMAKSLYQRLAYSDAIKLLNEFLAKKEDMDAEIMLADCYRQTNQYDKAEACYKKITDNVASTDNIQKLYYAQILQANGKYQEAAHMYQSFLLFYPKDVRANNQKYACENISKYTASTSNDYIITNAPFNTDGYDFGACLNKHKFYYTSTGSKNQKDVKTDKYLNEPYMNLYAVNLSDSDRLDSNSTTNPLSTGVNTKYHEGPMCFNGTGDVVYFTRNDYNPEKKGIRKVGFGSDKIINLKIYQANVNDTSWTKDVELPFNNKDYSCGHPTFDAANNVMYFTSDMPGGFGGTDIWMSKFDGAKWSEPKNLGPKVNTEANEMFPYFHASHVLYFSSEGLPGLGGLDIFTADISGDNMPINAVNIGAPLNSSRDDFGILLSDDKQTGYFSSNRNGGKGEDDIYRFVNNKYELEGIVVNRKTQQPMNNAAVKELASTNDKKDFNTNKEGKFNDVVYGSLTYDFSATYPDFQPDSAHIFIEPVEYAKKYYIKMELTPIVGEILVIDINTKMPIENAKVDMNSKCLDSTMYLSTATDGKTFFDIKNNCDYNLMANAKGYLPKTSKIVAVNIRDTLHHVIELTPINNDIITLNNIYYDFDKWYIRPDALPDLNMLLSFMRNNPDAIVELGSHTDARGIDDYNQKLSQRRAQSVVDWLIAKGIKKDKIIPVGYGETKPVNACVNDVTCTEEEHQKNRRTEFRVLNAGVVTVSRIKNNINVDKCKNCPF